MVPGIGNIEDPRLLIEYEPLRQVERGLPGGAIGAPRCPGAYDLLDLPIPTGDDDPVMPGIAYEEAHPRMISRDPGGEVQGRRGIGHRL